MSDTTDDQQGGDAAASKRKYTLSPAALEQRRSASREARKHATGPVTDEGKAISSRNGWKHGEYSAISKAEQWQMLGVVHQPCRTTCPQYPCSLVKDGQTKAGGDCLDKRVYVEAFESIIAALESGDERFTHGMLAQQLAGAVEVVNRMREFLVHAEPVVRKPVINRQGEVVINPKTNEPYERIDIHPVLVPYFKMLGELGVSFPEALVTPRAAAKERTNEETVDAFHELMQGVARAGGGGAVRRRTIDGEAEEVDDAGAND